MTTTLSALSLERYDISAERGFLASFDPETVLLPEFLQPIRDAALDLPHTLPAGAIRRRLDGLPLLDLTAFCHDANDAEHRIAMVHYSFLAQAYVWGEADPPRALPAPIAVPLWQLAKTIGQKPLLPYSGYVLDNWARLDPAGPIDLSNLRMIQPFLGGHDEAWFVIVHVAIEARAGRMLGCFPGLIAAAADGDHRAIEAGLETISAAWDDVNAIFDRMPEGCDPYIYFHRVRPWIHGWKDNPALGDGLIYDGVAETGGRPQAFRGQTGSQSSIVPAMDALFGIDHAADPLRAYLTELHDYRPPSHRRFIDDVRADSRLRAYVQTAGNKTLTSLYNDCVTKLGRFRTRHLEYAASYIHKQAKGDDGNHTDVGTGGTPFMKYLKKHRDEAEAQLLPVS